MNSIKNETKRKQEGEISGRMKEEINIVDIYVTRKKENERTNI